MFPCSATARIVSRQHTLRLLRGPPALARQLSVERPPDFDRVWHREWTGSIKYDKYAEGRDTAEMDYRDVMPLWVADMDFAAPDCVVRALRQRLDHPLFGYTGPNWDVKEPILNYLQGIVGSVPKQRALKPGDLVFLPGLVVALNIVARMAARRDEAVMTMTPIYPPFMSCAHNAGATSIAVPLRQKGDAEQGGPYTFDFEAMEAAVKDSPKRVGVFLLCNPHNPVGRVYTKEELVQLVKFCKRHEMILVSDEIHCELVLDKELTPHVPILAIEDPWVMHNTISLNAPSKTFNLAGLCAAFAVIPGRNLRSLYKRETAGVVADITPFGYTGLKVAYEDPAGECSTYRDALIQTIQANLDKVADRTQGSWNPYLSLKHRHEATYLAWIDARPLKTIVPQGNVAKWFEDEAGVGLNDGNTFGPGKQFDGYVRMNLACPSTVLEKALRRIDEALLRL
eukprot:CAMPEP_0184545730 /NCGR_PEP_ID=MMETSP0199_2-20130426/4500_1 /TAXON_ID=1112570 /ORGANISM="Thraustochytrium sp., Strain LLF1b" /LENGTH=453 /DNA_ID=CAMNT_0026940059 /DNA_START=43 /DNA_END=1404 /DNA_ORIENTATION=-